MIRRLVLYLPVAVTLCGVTVVAGSTKPAQASQTLLSISSAGKKSPYRSPTFHVAGSWQLWTEFNCTGVKSPDFHVAVLKSNRKRSGLADLHVHSRSGTRTKDYVRGGSFRLLVHSPCSWSIAVFGTPPPPKPTPTPQVPYTVQAQVRPCVTGPLQKGCADLGFTISQRGGSITLRQKDLGYTIQVSKFGVTAEPYGTGYALFMDVKATKTTPSNGSLASWSPSADSFSLTAANGHPYEAGSCGNPPFNDVALYNGESNEGYVCSASINPAYMETTFTWSFNGYATFGASSSTSFQIPLVDVTVSHR